MYGTFEAIQVALSRLSDEQLRMFITDCQYRIISNFLGGSGDVAYTRKQKDYIDLAIELLSTRRELTKKQPLTEV